MYVLLTVRLLTHVLCKPTHFFFHSFIATMSYSLQTSFNSVMKDRAEKYHVWGTPTGSPSRSNSRYFKNAFFSLKRNIYSCVLFSYLSYSILFEGVYFVLSYSTNVWNAPVAGNLFKNKKKQEKWSMPITEIKHVK